MARIEIKYLDGDEEVLEGTVTLLQGCLQIQKEIEEAQGPLVTVEKTTDSEYIPLTSIKKVRTLNSEEK